jgi:hypothetical protein
MRAMPEFMVFYIDPTEPQGSPWHTAGHIGGNTLTADEAIAKTVGRQFPDQPCWAFALQKQEGGAFYGLHYPPGIEPRIPSEHPLGPTVYVADPPVHPSRTNG